MSVPRVQRRDAACDKRSFRFHERCSRLVDNCAARRDEAWATLPHAPEKPLKPLPKVSAVRYIRAQEAAKRKAKGKKWMSETVSGLMSEEEEGAAENKTSKPTVRRSASHGPAVKHPYKDSAMAAGFMPSILVASSNQMTDTVPWGLSFRV